MAKYKPAPLEFLKPMCEWEQLVKEYFELMEDKEADTSERRREIHGRLQEIHQQYHDKHPQFFRDVRARSDDEFER